MVWHLPGSFLKRQLTWNLFVPYFSSLLSCCLECACEGWSSSCHLGPWRKWIKSRDDTAGWNLDLWRHFSHSRHISQDSPPDFYLRGCGMHRQDLLKWAGLLAAIICITMPESSFSTIAKSLSCQCSQTAKSAEELTSSGISPQLVTFGSWCINTPSPLALGWGNSEVFWGVLGCLPEFPPQDCFSYPRS